MLNRSTRLAALAASLVALLPAAATAAERRAAPPVPAPAPLASGRPVPGEVLVGFERGASGGERAAARRGAGVTVKRALNIPGVQLLDVAGGESIEAAIERLERNPHVRYAEPNRRRTASATTNDPLLGQLWGLSTIDAPEAWDVFTGGDPVVAVVDEGVKYDHPDLAPNMWRNPGEVPGNGADDDGNGFVDDVFGADVIDGDGDPMDIGGHGTHVAGTIAAAGNNGLGITGVTQTARLMAVRALGPGGGTDAGIAEAFEYAASMGARVVNASLGGPVGGDTMHAPILAHPETMFIVAAGNDGGDNDSLAGPDEFPCKYPDDNVICVAATTPVDTLASFSNFGSTSVDLAAPGTIVLSTGLGRTRLTDGFESGDLAGRWTPTLEVGTGEWGLATPGGASGHSVSDSPSGNYAPNTSTYLDLATPLNLSGATGCVMNFTAKTALGSGDRFLVYRSLNGGLNWSPLASSVVTGSTGVYRSFNVNLAADNQANVAVSFGLETNGSSQGDGVNVDDVSVTCASSPSGDASFRFLDGTSMATPHVTGAAALLLGQKPSLTVAQLRAALLNSGDPVAGLAATTVTGRRLNVNNALRSPLLVVPPVVRTGGSSGVTADAAVLSGTVTPRGTATSWQFELGTTTAYGSSTAPADAGSSGSGQAVSAPVGGLQPNTTYHYRLVAVRGSERFPGADATFTTGSPPVVRQPVVDQPAAPSLAARVKAARVACSRQRGTYRCRVSLTRGSALKARLVLKRGRKVLARGSGRVGKLIKLKGKKAKAGRYAITLTLIEGSKTASSTKRVRVR